MTKYDKLMDSIIDQLYRWYMIGDAGNGWDDAEAKEDAHSILKMVEEYQTLSTVKNWRASD